MYSKASGKMEKLNWSELRGVRVRTRESTRGRKHRKKVENQNDTMEKRPNGKNKSVSSTSRQRLKPLSAKHEYTVNNGNAKKLIASFHFISLSWKMIALLWWRLLNTGVRRRRESEQRDRPECCNEIHCARIWHVARGWRLMMMWCCVYVICLLALVNNCWHSALPTPHTPIACCAIAQTTSTALCWLWLPKVLHFVHTLSRFSNFVALHSSYSVSFSLSLFASISFRLSRF